MDLLFSLLMRGLFLGGLYALTGCALTIIVGILKIINIAHGDLLILAAYLSFIFLKIMGLDPLVSLAIIIPLMMVIGFIIQKYIVNPILTRGTGQVTLLYFSLSIIIQNILLLCFTADNRTLAMSYLLGGVNILGASFSLVHLISFLIAIIVFCVLHAFFKYTYLGKVIRAVPANPEAAMVLGLRPEKIFVLASGISMAVTGLAGVMIGIAYIFSPSSGVAYMMMSFGVILIGGLGSFYGALIGGILIGELMVLSGHFLGPNYQLIFCYIAILIVLILRPKGLFRGGAINAG
ncbi:MAG: branched-chain amino acid ABC transporter permease [Candidatus Bathyarchaeia archaeon]